MSRLPIRIEPSATETCGCAIARLVHVASTRPEAPAIRDARSLRWSYGHLLSAAAEIAAVLAKDDSTRMIAIRSDSGPGSILAMVAAQLAGRAFAVLDAGWPTARVGQAVDLLGPCDILDAAREAERVLPEASARSLGVAADLLGYHHRCAATAYVLFTSGTTGVPNAVAVTHEVLATHLDGVEQLVGDDARAPTLQFIAHTFDPAQQEIWLALSRGSELVCRSGAMWSTRKLMSVCREAGVRCAILPTAVWHMTSSSAALRRLVSESPEFLPRTMIVGGDAMSLESATRWQELVPDDWRLLNMYGPTEAVVAATCLTITRDWTPDHDSKSVPIGTAIPGHDTKLRIVDGGCELLLGGLLAQGYLGNASLTAQRFITDDRERRWYSTGDLVRETSNDGYEFLGRRDRQIKVRGYRIELSDVEAAARRLPGVVDAACDVLERAGGPEIWAFIAKRGPEAAHAADDVEQGLRAALPAYMVPSRIITLKSLPLSANGKVDHAMLVEQHASSRGDVAKPSLDADSSGRCGTED